MPAWVLPVIVSGAWCLSIIATAAQYAAEDARRGVPEGRRRGVSAFPVIPVCPLASWGVAWLINLAARPWGTDLVCVAHVVFAVFLVGSLVKDWLYLRKFDRPA